MGIHSIKILITIPIFLNILSQHGINAASCEIIPPKKHEGNEIGFIFVPGAQIRGEAYGPLSKRIQELFPGNVWIGLTEGWFNNFPNPLEIDSAIKDCYLKAEYVPTIKSIFLKKILTKVASPRNLQKLPP